MNNGSVVTGWVRPFSGTWLRIRPSVDLIRDNVVTIMTSPLSGTLAPGASARTEVQGIGVQSSPIEWFTRSNFGGRFAPMLKYAGWDGIVIEGKADKPVWVDIRNEDVKIKDARHLWGLDTWKTQEEIWREVSGRGYRRVGGIGFGKKNDPATRCSHHWPCRREPEQDRLPHPRCRKRIRPGRIWWDMGFQEPEGDQRHWNG